MHAIATLFKSGRTITPDQARREALSLRDPARQELQSGIDAATRTLNAGQADSATLKELRGLRGELKALESDTQVGTVLRHIDQAQKVGIEKMTVLRVTPFMPSGGRLCVVLTCVTISEQGME